MDILPKVGSADTRLAAHQTADRNCTETRTATRVESLQMYSTGLFVEMQEATAQFLYVLP